MYFRCVVCGMMMPSLMDDYFHCTCGAMSLDVGYGRFGSNHGDRNILVYERVQ